MTRPNKDVYKRQAYGTKLERLYRLVNGKAEALEFIPKGTDPYIGIPLRKLNICLLYTSRCV